MEIVISNVSKYIKGVQILDNVNLKLTNGHIYGIQGHNGSGKTMLLRLIAGLIHSSSGTIMINGAVIGKDIDFYSSMGVLIETPAFLANYSGYRNLKLLAQIQGRIAQQEIMQAMLDVGLDPDDPKKVRKYSLGMNQRLGLAAAIMEKPDLILLDEPTNALDRQGINNVCDLMEREKNRGALIVMASHDDSIISKVADEIFTVTSGKIEKRV